jgi:uncharacterized protein
MARKKGNNYFDILFELIDYSYDAASILNNTLINFNKLDEMHKIEHAADLKKHDMVNKLVKEFITPIERGDIVELANQIDNVTDNIEDILIRIYMFNVTSMKQEAMEFSNLILKCCEELKGLLKEFKNFKKSENIHKLVIDLNDLEEEGDKLYTISVRNLFLNTKDPIELMIWKETFKYFERCCDACESVANVIESVIMENS